MNNNEESAVSENNEIAGKTNEKIPSWFKYVAIFAFVWNLLGVMAFIAQIAMTPDMLADLPKAEQDLYANTPIWATIAFGVAVFGGAFGCVALIAKKSISSVLLILSLAGVCVQMFHAFIISNSFEVFGPSGTIMPIMVIVIAIALVRLSLKAKANHWIT